MELYFVFIAIGSGLFVIGLVALLWSVRSGQYDDLDTPALRMLIEDGAPASRPPSHSTTSPPTTSPPTHRSVTARSTL